MEDVWSHIKEYALDTSTYHLDYHVYLLIGAKKKELKLIGPY